MENETQQLGPGRLEPVPECTTNVWTAIAEIQQRVPVIEKTATNTFFSSKYTLFEDIQKRLMPLFKELGLVCIQPIGTPPFENTVLVTTIIHHLASGTQVESPSVVPIVPSKGQQMTHAFGSSSSYARRYSLTSLLGIVCGSEDDDGNAGDMNPPPQQPTGQPPAQQQPADDREARFWAWIKTIAPTRDDFLALCAWLAVTEVKDLDPAHVKGHPEVQGCIGRAVKRITEQQKIPLDVMMENARAFFASQQVRTQNVQ